MGTRGIYGFRKNKKDKLIYNHWDSYPEGLGADILDYIRKHTIKSMNEVFNRINIADDKKPISEYSEEKLKEYQWLLDKMIRNKKNKQNISIYNVVDEYICNNGLLNAFDEKRLNLYNDDSKFILDSLSCEWGYILNLDNNTLEVWKGYQTTPNKNNRYGTEVTHSSFGGVNYYPCLMIYSIKFSEIKKKTNKEIVDEIYSQSDLITYLENLDEDSSKKLSDIKDEYIELSKIKNDTVLYGYLDSIYREGLEYIGMDKNKVENVLKKLLEDCYIETDRKDNNDILKEIRDGILNELRKQINYHFFNDKHMD